MQLVKAGLYFKHENFKARGVVLQVAEEGAATILLKIIALYCLVTPGFPGSPACFYAALSVFVFVTYGAFL